MKKTVASITVLVLLVTVLFPLQAFASYDKELEKAIGRAKSLFDIPKGYDNFEYSMHKQEDKTVFNLRWNDSKGKLGNISATIDSDGKVTEYYSYKPYPGGRRQKLPAISKSDALKVADAFIQKVNPALSAKLQYQESDMPLNIYEEGYRFFYTRVENGIPYPENNVNVLVDGITGEIRNYNCNWYDNVEFPKAEGILPLDKAQQEYINKLGLKLVYKLNYEQREPKPYLVYTNVYNNQYLDAKTGEVINGSGGYYGYYGYYGGAERMYDAGAGMNSLAGDKAVSLNPQEQKAVESAAGIMDQNKAEETARKKLNVSQEYKLNYISLYNNWQNKDDYTWSMDFSRKTKSGDERYEGINVSLDAKTGDILNFYRFSPQDSMTKVKYSREQAIKTAEAFVKSMQPKEAAETELTPWSEPVYEIMSGAEQPRQYYLTFTRKANGAYFVGNGFNITVDGVTGDVINYNFNWYKKELPSASSIITLDQAHDILFGEIGIQQQYISLFNRGLVDAKIAPAPTERSKPEIGLVYAIKPGKPVNIDAASGKLLDYNGKPLEEASIAKYTDIKGHFAENQIKVLAEFGISLPGEKLEPNKAITQKEFLYLLLKATQPYIFVGTADSVDEETLYNALTNAGIVKDGDKSPGSVIQRQDAVKFIVRALNYGKVAELDKGIFKLPFKDADKISSGLYGYMAVGYGLKIIAGSDGYCNPSAGLTRAQGFVMLYNFLNVN